MVRVSGWVFDEAGLLESALLVAGDGSGTPEKAKRILGYRPGAQRRYVDASLVW
jgi:hypothetical protein